jgi:hypothetical protein
MSGCRVAAFVEVTATDLPAPLAHYHIDATNHPDCPGAPAGRRVVTIPTNAQQVPIHPYGGPNGHQ